MSRKRALLSVYKKDGIVEFARFLVSHNFEIISSGGTSKLLAENNIAFTPVNEVTGSPEILDGRVKTLHPNIHSGILAKRNASHQQQLLENNIKLIDLVVVNLYPFEETIAKDDSTFDEAIEKIDIGGPTMIRAAAKNHQYVTVLTDSAQYELFQKEFEQTAGQISAQFRKDCAAKVFSLMAKYDAAIAGSEAGLTSDGTSRSK